MAQKPSNTTANTETDEAAALLNEAQQNEVTQPGDSNIPALRLGQVNVEETDQGMASSGQSPILRTAFGVGNLADEGHAPGTVVLGDYVIGKKNDKIILYVLAANFYWKENTEFRPGVRIEAQRLPTAGAVHALGKTTEWRDGANGKRIQPDFRPAADFILLIEQPNEKILSPDFSLRIEGKNYAIARYYTDKNVYTYAGEVMLKSVKGAPVPFAVEFTFLTKQKTVGNNSGSWPTVTLNGKTDEALVESIQEHLNK